MIINLLNIEFELVILKAGFNKKEAAAYLGKSLRTIDRWCQYGAPLIAIRALEHRAGIAPGWEKHQFRPGHFTTPADEWVTQAELHHFAWTKGIYKSLAEGRRSRRFNGVKPARAAIISLEGHIKRHE